MDASNIVIRGWYVYRHNGIAYSVQVLRLDEYGIMAYVQGGFTGWLGIDKLEET